MIISLYDQSYGLLDRSDRRGLDQTYTIDRPRVVIRTLTDFDPCLTFQLQFRDGLSHPSNDRTGNVIGNQYLDGDNRRWSSRSCGCSCVSGCVSGSGSRSSAVRVGTGRMMMVVQMTRCSRCSSGRCSIDSIIR